jgi:membrane protein DedA with SNARE-associated domain
MLASIIDVSHVGYVLLFLLIMAESSGVPIPGETALIAASVLASQGKLEIELVIAFAALGAIVGDNIGYAIGRRGARRLLLRPGRFERERLAALEMGEPFFERHGPKAVFFGRFVLGLRVWASWLAGATRMRWRSFLFWNACGGITWAAAVGLIAYFLGHSASSAIEAFGIFALVAVLAAALSAGLLLYLRRGGRLSRGATSDPAAGPPANDGDATATAPGAPASDREATATAPASPKAGREPTH